MLAALNTYGGPSRTEFCKPTVEMASGKITGSQGQSFTAGKLGPYTVGLQNSVLLGPPYVFSAANINKFNF